MEDLVEKLRSVTAKVFGGTPVLFAYLYGSHARDQAGSSSDIDIAAYLEPDHANDAFALSLSLASAVEEATGRGPVEALLILNDAPIALAGRVVQDGVVVYSRDEPARVRHSSLTLRQFHDFRIHERRSTQERLERMATET